MAKGTPEIPAKRRSEKRELITLFNSMKPGQEITPYEIQQVTGLDVRNHTGDRRILYEVREHCRLVLGFCIEYVKKGGGGNLVRATDQQVVNDVVTSRRQRIFNQVKRGVAETMAIADFEALPRDDQVRLLAHQSIFDTVAVASHRDAPAKVLTALEKHNLIEAISPERVLTAIRAIKQ